LNKKTIGGKKRRQATFLNNIKNKEIKKVACLLFCTSLDKKYLKMVKL